MLFKTKMNIILTFILVLTMSLTFLPSITAKTYEEPKNITGFTDLFQWENRVTDYKFGIATLIMVFLVSFIVLKGFESSQAFTGCLFFTAVTAISLRVVEILNNTWTIGTIIVCALVALLIMWGS